MNQNKNDLFMKHELFQILSGHPHAISLSSTLLKKKSLLGLYKILSYIKRHRSTAQDESNQLSLYLSFEASLEFLRTVNQQAHEVLMFFSVAPSGLIEDDMESVWDVKWRANREALTSQDILTSKPFSISGAKEAGLFQKTIFSLNQALRDIAKKKLKEE